MVSNHQAKNDTSVENSLRAQANVRVFIAVPALSLILLYEWYRHGTSGMAALAIALVPNALYPLIAFYFARHPKPFSIGQLVIATAILDSVLLSVMLSILNEVGSLFICFYLFTILGYGFRIGQRAMLVCQIFAIAGFSTVMLTVPIWEQHPLFSASFLFLLIVVPFYAKILIRKLHDARALAENESRAKSELLAKVSHELRTPITGIMASAELLLAESHSKEAAPIEKRVNTILSLSMGLLAEINDLLDTAKYNANALALEKATFDLRDVMEQLRLTLASAAAAKHIGLTVGMDDAICDFIESDAHYLNKVLTNIAGNAVKFTDKGSVDVTCTLLEEGENFYVIRFSVRDTGIGIPRELHQKIFEPFVQASSGTTRQFGGTGLGMSIAKELVSLMGGEIKLESEPGKGSLFFFDLKFSKIAKDRFVNTNQQEEVRVVYGKRILVADDNETNLILIKELLETDRHIVTTASSGQQTLDILNTQEFDVIFLDYNMGDIEGSKVLQIYQKVNGNIPPTFFLTADTTAATSEKLVATGAMGVLHKPISRDRLRHTLATVFGAEAMALESGSGSTNNLGEPVPSTYFYNEMIEELTSISPRPGFLVDLLKNAIDDIEANCKNLLSTIEANDFNRVAYRAHALASACSAVGAVRLDCLARKIMGLTLSELMATREKHVSEINETLVPTIKALKSYLHDAACKSDVRALIS